MSDTTKEAWPAHPAKFSDPIIAELADAILSFRLARALPPPRILDPFAGVGKIHQLDHLGYVIGCELQERWARQSHGMVIGNSERLPFVGGAFDLVITSPCYGNRMADSHVARERCRVCQGMKEIVSDDWGREVCGKCGGTGRGPTTRRHTYTHYYGEPLHKRNAGRLQWGPQYRLLHYAVWRECKRVLKPGGQIMLNVSNHIRGGKEMDVVGFHRWCLRAFGLTIVREMTIPTQRNRHGANYEARVDGEQLIIATKK